MPSDRVTFLLGGAEFGPALDRDIRGARERVLLQTLSYEADGAGLLVARALRSSKATVRRFRIDAYSLHFVNDRLIHTPGAWLDGGLRREVKATRHLVEELGQAGVEVTRLHTPGWNPFRMFVRDHKKLAVVDRRVSYVGGINLCDHNFAWHDSMLRFDDPAVTSFLAADFEGAPGAATEYRSPLLDLYSADGRGNGRIREAARSLIAGARRTLYLHCPYVTEPFLGWLGEAAQRGVKVTLVTSGRNNRMFMRDSIQEASERHGFELFFTEDMTHFKLLIVDGKELLTGSANFDELSFRTQPEYVVVTRDLRLIREIERRVAGPRSEVAVHPPEGRLSRFRAWRARAALSLANGIMRLTME